VYAREDGLLACRQDFYSSSRRQAQMGGCKWILKLNFVNGVEQLKGVDCFQSFSPTASQVILRLVLALTASLGFLSVDLDATSAFISAPLQDNEQVYMTAAPSTLFLQVTVFML